MIETAKSKQTKYRLYVLCLLIQCDDCNHINRNTSIMQDKMLIKSVTFDCIFKVTTGP